MTLTTRRQSMSTELPPSVSGRASAKPYALALLVCGLTAALALPLRSVLDQANIVMLFLLAVFLVAARLGRGPAVMAAFACVGLFDFFFVLPHLSFAVDDAQYLVTFAVMLTVGLLTTHLVARLHEQTAQALASENATRRLYEAARDMAGALTRDQVIETARVYLASHDLAASVLLANEAGELATQGKADHELGKIERSFAESAYCRNELVEADSLAGTGIAVAFFPLRASTRVLGVLALTPPTDDTTCLRRSRPAILALASLVALAIERLHYVQAAQEAQLRVTEERLRTSVLSSLSHDLRTPLTTLVGLADTLVQVAANDSDDADAGPQALETATVIREQAQTMYRLLADLLDMARLHGQRTALRCAWQPFDEVVGSSLRIALPALGRRQVSTSVAKDLPLVYVDAVLIERVLCNLLDNAGKYSPEGAAITLTVTRTENELVVRVENDGPGFPPERIGRVFQMFVRGVDESPVPGVGLGLAICKAVIDAHHGDIHAENHDGKACVEFRLPLGTPPLVEEDEA